MNNPEAAQEKATMSDMAEIVYSILDELRGRNGFDDAWGNCDQSVQSEIVAELTKLATDLTYPKAKVDELIEVTKEISGRLKYSDTSDNGHVDSYSVELIDKARQAIAQLQANGTGEG